MLGAAVAYVLVPDAGRAPARRVWIALGAVSIAFHLWLVFSGLVPNLVSRPLHLALALPWVLLGATGMAGGGGAESRGVGEGTLGIGGNASGGATAEGPGGQGDHRVADGSSDVGGEGRSGDADDAGNGGARGSVPRDANDARDGPLHRLVGLVLTALGVAACLWVAWHHETLADQYGYLDGAFQTVLAAVLLVAVLEAARRAIGWPLPLVALLALLYGLFGQHVPGELGHPGLPLASFLGTLAIAEGGLWGSLTGVSVGIVAIFVILGAALNAGEAGEGFMNLAAAAAGRLRGGAAKVSVLSSALFGSLSGSASANVASTGTVTLPAMRRLGYPPALAGAVEAVASSGGQIMPPLMGAGAFVMVELTGIPYADIMAAATLPAVLYFVAVWLGIDGFCTRHALPPLPPEARPPLGRVALTSLFFAVPFGTLLVVMFALGRTPQYAASLAILAAAALLAFDAKGRVPRRALADRLVTVCLQAGRQIAVIAAIIVCASIVVGVLGATGLGVKTTSMILALSGGSLWPALGLTALACLLLGMEVPTTAAYVICVSVAGPALATLGLAPLEAHLFVFWFALLSTITPPVCGAVFIAAGMVGENWLRVAVRAMALGVGLYLIPLAMIANPALITLAERPLAATATALQVALGLGLVSWAVIRPRAAWRRALVGAGGLVVLYARAAIG